MDQLIWDGQLGPSVAISTDREKVFQVIIYAVYEFMFRSSKRSKKFSSGKFTKAMLYELMSTMSDVGENSNNNSDNSKSEGEEDDATLLVNSATYTNVSPANIRKLMSVPNKKKPPDESKKKRTMKGNKTKLSAKEDSDEEITLNGGTY